MAVSREFTRHASLRAGNENDENENLAENEQNRSPFVIYFERAVVVVSGFIITLLMIRLVLSLLGTSREGALADFVYTASHPLVTPFFRLFNYRLMYGQSRFEVETLIAAAVYAIITALILTVMAMPKESQQTK